MLNHSKCRRAAAVAACLSGLLVLVFTGCGRSDSDAPTGGQSDRRPRHADFLPTIMSMARPERLGLETSAQQVAGQLNRWHGIQTVDADSADAVRRAKLSPEAAALVTDQLPPGTLEDIHRERFDERDAEYLRTARLMRQIVDRVVKGEPDPAMRAVAVCDYVARNVELVADGEVPPLTPYEVLLYGRGTTADRAWIFVELLRQLQIDTVVLTPAGKETEQTPERTAETLRVGVLIDEELLLFDPQTGAGVPPSDADEAADAAPDAARPATLAELPTDHVRLWRPAVVGTAALWSPRMRLLQSGLRGDEMSAVVYQPLLSGDGGRSVLERMRSAVEPASGSVWSADDVTLWAYPQQQLNLREAGDVLVYEKLREPMGMPLPAQLVPVPGAPPGSARTVLGAPTWTLWKARTDQLLGQFRIAIDGYQHVQGAASKISRLPNVSLDVRRNHEDAAEDSVFWIGLAQINDVEGWGEQRYPIAATRFSAYITQYKERGRHTGQARLLLAEVLTEQGDLPAAVAALREVPETDPLYPAAQHRIRRWSSAGSTPSPSSAPQSPEQPQPLSEPEPAIAEKPAR
jgi:hypothetical protein